MIKITVLPERKNIVVKRDSIRVKELLEYLNEYDLESIAVIVNNKLIDNLDYEIKSRDKVLIIRQATGGV